MKEKLVRFFMASPGSVTDLAILLLRLGFGLGMLAHGVPKLMEMSTAAESFPDPLGVGSPVSIGLTVFAEVLCALGVAVGFLTRLALIPLIVTMAVAMLLIHGADPWAKKEAAFLYLIPYLTLMLSGPGRFSVDFFLWKQKSR